MNGQADNLPLLLAILSIFNRDAAGKEILKNYGAVEFFCEYLAYNREKGFERIADATNDFLNLVINDEASRPKAAEQKAEKKEQVGISLNDLFDNLLQFRSSEFCFLEIEIDEREKQRLLKLISLLKVVNVNHQNVEVRQELAAVIDNLSVHVVAFDYPELFFESVKVINFTENFELANFVLLKLMGFIEASLQMSARFEESSSEPREKRPQPKLAFENILQIFLRIFLKETLRNRNAFCFEKITLLFSAHLRKPNT